MQSNDDHVGGKSGSSNGTEGTHFKKKNPFGENEDRRRVCVNAS